MVSVVSNGGKNRMRNSNNEIQFGGETYSATGSRLGHTHKIDEDTVTLIGWNGTSLWVGYSTKGYCVVTEEFLQALETDRVQRVIERYVKR